MANASSPSAQLTRIAALDDNYIWLLANPSSHELAIIDPGEAEPVIAWLEEHSITPTEIINTHHHGDHINGNAELAERYGIPLTGPASEQARINGMTRMVAGGDHLTIAGYSAQVINTPVTPPVMWRFICPIALVIMGLLLSVIPCFPWDVAVCLKEAWQRCGHP